MKTTLLGLILAVGVSLIAIALFNHVSFEKDKCPFCYGEEFCYIKNISLRFTSISESINNFFSVKNVYFTTQQIILKKLAHNEELNKVDQHICAIHEELPDCHVGSLDTTKLNYTKLLQKALQGYKNGYQICGDQGVEIVLIRLTGLQVEHLWTMSLINFEPLFLKMFSNAHFSNHLPNYYGACGRIIAVENCGRPLNYFAIMDWTTRATIARSIIAMAVKFTNGDDDFRVYLTDISSDNLVVDEATLEAKFVDLENIILTQKTNVSNIHKSEYHSDDGEGFIFMGADICQSSISDHNIYSICKLLFSPNAPWPMMQNGLLHSPPEVLRGEDVQMLEWLIDSCVRAHPNHPSRFDTIATLDKKLEEILSGETN